MSCHHVIKKYYTVLFQLHRIISTQVVDPDFRGNLSIVLCNLGTQEFDVFSGDRIAQLILEKFVDDALIIEVEKFNENTNRGADGFGSTGVN